MESPPPPAAKTEPVTVPAIGETLGGKYRIEEVLGKGGMGVVLGARHGVLGHRVAIKLLSSAARANPTHVARFLREARATLELKSEHVVRVLDEGRTDDGTPFLVMEHLEGDDLHRVLTQRGPLPIAEAVEYVLEACDAMVEAHARGIVHRDLKPSNLFLTRRGDGRALVKVLDFGISKLAPGEGEGELTETLAILGSPGYMAPEQIRSAKYVDHRADVWGLGIVLFRLLTRRSAFDGEGAMGLCAAILSDPPRRLRELLPEAPEALEALIARCLEKDPAKRFQTVAELAEQLCVFAPDSRAAARFRSTARPEPAPHGPAPIVADAATNVAVSSQVSNASPSRWPYVVAAAAVTIAVFVGLRARTPAATPVAGAPSPGSATPGSTTPGSPPPTSAAPAKAAESSSSSPETPSTPLSPSTSVKPVLKKPVVHAKPAGSTKPTKPWGSTIDDPL